MTQKYWIKHLVGTLVFFALPFLAAGRINYAPGWVYVSLGTLMLVLQYTVLRIDPSLMIERGQAGEGAQKWDKTIVGLLFLCTIALSLVAGFDSGRYHPAQRFPVILSLLGIALTFSGQLLFLVAQKQNRFFSSILRNQSDRGHTVCHTGLYSFVRHPAYLGMIIQTIGFPLVFASPWSIIPATAIILLVIIRTKKEDEALRAELTGYTEYCQQTPFRLIPNIW